MRDTWTFHSAGSLLFGRHAADKTGEVAARLGAKRVFVVTDTVLIGAGILEPIHGSLSEMGMAVGVFDGGKPEPAIGIVRDCVTAARAFKPDLILGLGGGSNMDTAKLTSLVLAHGKDATDYTGDCKVPGPVMPVVCVPTTAGTGSEVSAAAVFTDTDRHIKVSCLSNYLRPAVAVVDPLLTVSCPPKVTADSGIDVLTHAVEAFTAVDNATFTAGSTEQTVYQGKNPMADATAEQSIRLVGQHLRRAVADGNDLEARDGMALAATLGGLAFSNAGVALVHAMEYPVGGVTHCSHGAGNGLLLPFVMRYNLPVRVKEFAAIARFLGADVAGMGDQQAAETAVATVEKLRSDIGIPARLRDLGAKQEHLAGFAEKTFAVKRLMRVNPRMPTCAEIEEVFRAAW
jgi:alcohol dehydrogenase class IV